MNTISPSNTNSSASKRPKSIAGNVFESIKNLGSATVKTTFSEAGKMGTGMANSMLGGNLFGSESVYNQPPMAPERMMPGFQKKAEKPKPIQIFSLVERQESMRTSEAIRQLVTEIRREVIMLERQHKMIIAETSRITVENLPEKVGVYHVNFFEWLLRLLRDVRTKVGESTTWLAAARGKRARKGYWGMYKKHGTSFGLSGERTAATQSG